MWDDSKKRMKMKYAQVIFIRKDRYLYRFREHLKNKYISSLSYYEMKITATHPLISSCFFFAKTQPHGLVGISTINFGTAAAKKKRKTKGTAIIIMIITNANFFECMWTHFLHLHFTPDEYIFSHSLSLKHA